jgi:hypothetical protein
MLLVTTQPSRLLHGVLCFTRCQPFSTSWSSPSVVEYAATVSDEGGLPYDDCALGPSADAADAACLLADCLWRRQSTKPTTATTSNTAHKQQSSSSSRHVGYNRANACT